MRKHWHCLPALLALATGCTVSLDEAPTPGERVAPLAVRPGRTWKPCGTTASRVADLAPGRVGSEPGELVHGEGTLFFSAETTGRGREPWLSDGTPSGTHALEELVPGASGSGPSGFIRSGWDVFFTAEDGAHGRELWALPFRPNGHCPSGRQALPGQEQEEGGLSPSSGGRPGVEGPPPCTRPGIARLHGTSKVSAARGKRSTSHGHRKPSSLE
ncbi:hypothetical protein [Archangium sp.]|uniref:hypothetical protein n=1 Tax=Archangium sp. TaxID=1872627 RepID=UPI002869F6FC|nr:hypothetical protein [Archangium sp.]